MSETTHWTPGFYYPEDMERYFEESAERESGEQFELLPFDPSNFPGDKLALLRADTATRIKESLQDFTHLDEDVRLFREASTRGDYAWAIIADLGMTRSEMPTKSYREAFSKVHEKAVNLRSTGAGELMEAYEMHPALDFIDTLSNIAPRTSLITKEIIMLRRSMLVLLDEHSQ